MRRLRFLPGLFLIAGLVQGATAATLPSAPPYVILLSFDRTVTQSTVTNVRTGEVKQRPTGGVRPFTFRFNSNKTSYFFQSGDFVNIEGPGLPGFGRYGLIYDFDTQAGELDFGISFPDSVVFRYTFTGTTGTFQFEEEDFRNRFPIQRGVLSNVTVDVKTPAVPLPASLPLLAAGLLGLGAWRRRRA